MALKALDANGTGVAGATQTGIASVKPKATTGSPGNSGNTLPAPGQAAFSGSTSPSMKDAAKTASTTSPWSGAGGPAVTSQSLGTDKLKIVPNKPTGNGDDNNGNDDETGDDNNNNGRDRGGSPSSSSTPADTTPVASPTDYYGDAAATTSRITKGVDTSEQIKAADQAWNDATRGFETKANDILNQLQSITEEDLANYADATGQTIADATAQINQIIAGMQDKMQPVEAGRVDRVDTVEEENLLRQIVDAQKQESENRVNYTVQQGVNDLTRAEEDAQEQFQTQRDQIAADERRSLDNSALYSEMRGDRGGIGKAQYDSIQNTAAANQLTVNKQQTKLATDTARQIADLRAQGEFTKADEVLKITQSYLKELMDLKQWADSTNVSVDEFNIGVEQWEQEYNAKLQQALGELGINAVQYSTGLNLDRDKDLQGQRQSLNNALAQYGLSNAQYTNQSDVSRISDILKAWQTNANNMASTEMAAANITGAFSDATPTQQARARADAQLAEAGKAMLSAGLTPSDAQLSAMGWSKDQYDSYKKIMDDAKKHRGSGGKRSLTAMLRGLVEAGTVMSGIEHVLQSGVESGNYSDVKEAQEYAQQLRDHNWEGWTDLPKS